VRADGIEDDGRQARASIVIMRLWKPHDPGSSCLLHTDRSYVTNRPIGQNAGALNVRDGRTGGVHSPLVKRRIAHSGKCLSATWHLQARKQLVTLIRPGAPSAQLRDQDRKGRSQRGQGGACGDGPLQDLGDSPCHGSACGDDKQPPCALPVAAKSCSAPRVHRCILAGLACVEVHPSARRSARPHGQSRAGHRLPTVVGSRRRESSV